MGKIDEKRETADYLKRSDGLLKFSEQHEQQEKHGDGIKEHIIAVARNERIAVFSNIVIDIRVTADCRKEYEE